MATAPDESWMTEAVCRTLEPDAMFPLRAADQIRAARHCAGCPVRSDCLNYALRLKPEYGVWGGMTERHLRALQRRMVAA
jgi:WhiB family redox-sensing transcriptional regulator